MRALIVGHTGGIGRAVQAALQARNIETVGVSRATHGVDLRDASSIEGAFAQISGPFDYVVVATGQLGGGGTAPEKSLKQLTPEAMADQFAVNAIGPAMLLRQLPRLLAKDKPSKLAVLSARVGSIGDNRLGGWYSYRAAKAALNQLVHSAAIELARSHPQACLISYHPGTVETGFTAKYQESYATVSAATAAQNLLKVLDGLGAEHSGGFYDWKGEQVPW